MTDFTNTPALQSEAELGDYFELLKPRVMQLVVFTAVVGLIAAPEAVNPIVAFASILFVAVGAGASGALNMWWDADIDTIMRRTAGRPIPAGKVQPGEALALGIALSGLSVMMLGLSANLLAAAMLLFTIFFYAVVYSMWLKRATPQNIVIGGAAGAFPPVIGWIIATGGFSVEAWLMFAIIFMWTPPHFWALALFMRSDYDDAQVPMLTVTHGRLSTRRHIMSYTLILAVLAIATGFTSIGGYVYLTCAVVLNGLFIRGAFRIWQRDEAAAEVDNYLAERRFFRLSLLYLFLLFGAIMVEALLKPWGLGGWA
ncbi:MAG: heme o synthase [Pseudomonadota bacterium]